MSFQDLAKDGTRELSNYENKATREVEGLIFKLVSNITKHRKLVDVLGTAKDTLHHRQEIAIINAAIQELAKSIKEKLTVLHDGLPSGLGAPPGRAAGVGPASTSVSATEQHFKTKRLLQDFANILQDYKSVQRLAAEREAACLPRHNRRGTAAVGGGTMSERTPLLSGGVLEGASLEGPMQDDIEARVRSQAQRQAEVASLDDSVAYHEALIEERDAGIREIQRQIGEVNEMFQDLAVLIADQGAQVETVDVAMTSVAERVREGQRELVAASRSSRAVRNKCLMLWLVAAVAVSVLLIILLS